MIRFDFFNLNADVDDVAAGSVATANDHTAAGKQAEGFLVCLYKQRRTLPARAFFGDMAGCWGSLFADIDRAQH